MASVYTLPMLPDELKIPLDRVTIPDGEGGHAVICEYPGVVAWATPMGLEEASRWNDAFPGDDHRSMAATSLVRELLKRIDGLNLTVTNADGTTAAVPYDHSNPRHWASIPVPMRSGIFLVLRRRASVSDDTEKNSDWPSGSAAPTNTPACHADDAATASASN